MHFKKKTYRGSADDMKYSTIILVLQTKNNKVICFRVSTLKMTGNSRVLLMCTIGFFCSVLRVLLWCIIWFYCSVLKGSTLVY